MKKLLIVLCFIICFFSINALASEDDYNVMDGRIFYTFLDNYLVVTAFYQGPFSGGEGGQCEVYANGTLFDTYNYALYSNNIVKVYGFCDFLLDTNGLTQITYGVNLKELNSDYYKH